MSTLRHSCVSNVLDLCRLVELQLGRTCEGEPAEMITLPFLAIVLDEGTPESPGNIAIAQNHCAGASSAAVKWAEDLMERVAELAGRDRADVAFNTAAFSIATTGALARIYLTWKSADGACCVRPLKSFNLTDARHFFRLRTTVDNILVWGFGDRLKDVFSALSLLPK